MPRIYCTYHTELKLVMYVDKSDKERHRQVTLEQTFKGLDDVKYIDEEIEVVIKVLENEDDLLVKKFICEDD